MDQLSPGSGRGAPARSGPFCLQDIVGSCVDYPYTDVAEFVPVEYVWMYPALLMALGLVVLALWFGVDLEYRYEVAAILTDWITLIVSGALLGVCFWRARPKMVR